VHYTMGGLWVDYNLMSTVPGLFVLGEANFSDHGANRLGASALMQGLADGYFVIPATIGGYLAGIGPGQIAEAHPAFDGSVAQVQQRIDTLLAIKGRRTVDSFHRELGLILWDYCGMARTNAGLTLAREKIRALRAQFWENAIVPGASADFNQGLEKAGRVADFMEFAELMVIDALERQESCGGHFNEAYQTPEGEALRNDADFCHVTAWQYQQGHDPLQHREPLVFENVALAQRSYT